jgi:hypothetical protein
MQRERQVHETQEAWHVERKQAYSRFLALARSAKAATDEDRGIRFKTISQREAPASTTESTTSGTAKEKKEKILEDLRGLGVSGATGYLGHPSFLRPT